jgi:hypothetical protein
MQIDTEPKLTFHIDVNSNFNRIFCFGRISFAHEYARGFVTTLLKLTRLLRNGTDRAAPRDDQVVEEIAVDAVFLADLCAHDNQTDWCTAPHRKQVADAALVAFDCRLLLSQLTHSAQPAHEANLHVREAFEQSRVPLSHQ